MKLTPAHKALIKLLAAAAVGDYIAGTNNLLHKEKPTERKGEDGHGPKNRHPHH
jgi:hypothetical protein